MNILIVHNVENLARARRSTLDHIYCFERYAAQHTYVYHRMMLPVTETLRTTPWDLVIFESTSLGAVTLRPRNRFQHLREGWRFLRDHPAAKVAFPQDDATHSAYLDYFFSFIGVDAVFSVRPERKEQLYPLTSAKAEFISTVAGFIDDASLEELSARARPFADRRWLLGQRVTMYPAWGGRFARRKGEIAERLQAECRARGLTENISTDPTDVFVGDDWYSFLGDCRFVVGAEGGHGLHDPYGAIQDDVNDYVARHPEASFDEIEDACFHQLDQRDSFPGFPPRILEAAVMGCGQLLLEGAYRGFIKPGAHYIEIREDYSNIEDVFAAMANETRVKAMIAATRSDLVDNPEFRYSTLVARVIEYAERLASARLRKPVLIELRAIQGRYRLELVAALFDVLRQEGYRGEALTQKVADTLHGQEARPFGEGPDAASVPFDWGVFLPTSPPDPPPAPDAIDAERLRNEKAANAEKGLRFLSDVEMRIARSLADLNEAAAAVDVAAPGNSSRADAVHGLRNVLAAIRAHLESMEIYENNIAWFARLGRIDRQMADLIAAIRPESDNGDSETRLAEVENAP